ncbi:MAG: 2-oxo acid dehydrogenase subunit E2 [Vicinamibacterales bacterium]
MTTFTLPELGENVAAGTVSRVLVQVGDTIARDQGVLELETDKATVEVPSAVAGVVQSIAVKKGDKVSAGMPVLVVSGDQPAPVAAVPAEAAVSATPTAPDSPVQAVPAQTVPVQTVPATPERAEVRARGSIAPASPRVHRLAREIGVSIHDVAGTGAEGRITQQDVKAHATRALSGPGLTGPAGLSQPTARALPDPAKWGEVDRQPMSSVRRATAVHLAHAWATVPQVTQADKADITELEEIRKRLAPDVEARGGKLTMTAILVKVLAAAVREYPQFNAAVDMAAEQIVFKRYVNVGVAVDTDRGLLVPVVRNADRKGLADIAIEIQGLAGKARDKKLTLDEMSGGGISISNLGGIGGTHFTPIVNWPEVAILGVSRGSKEPVFRNGAFEPRLMLPLSLSYDHRLIDGADGIRFLRWIVETLEQPFRLALVG